MGSLAKPPRGFGPVSRLHNIKQSDNIEVFLGIGLEWVSYNIGEAPWGILDEWHDKPVGFRGCSHRDPCSSRVHRGEMPFLLLILLGDKWA
jgi:hypothetical protein